MSRRVLIALLGLAATALVGLGLYYSAGGPSRDTGPVEKITLGAFALVHAAPVWIAENNRYFEQQGLEVKIRNFDSGRAALTAMLKKPGLDMATVAQTPMVIESFDRKDYAIIAGMARSDQDVKLAARKDRVRGPQDLRGKTVGVTAGTIGHFFLSSLLTLHGLGLSDVKTVNLDAPRLTAALVEGHVDAIATWEPHIFRAKKALGKQAVVFPGQNIVRDDLFVVAPKVFIKAHPRALKRFLRAVDQAERFIADNPAQAKAIVRKRLNQDKETLDATWVDLQFALFLDQSTLTSLEDQARWAVDNKLVRGSRVPNYLDYIHADALKAVKPEAVTIVGE